MSTPGKSSGNELGVRGRGAVAARSLGRIQAPCLGVDAAAWDDEGRRVTGAPGELVMAVGSAAREFAWLQAAETLTGKPATWAGGQNMHRPNPGPPPLREGAGGRNQRGFGCHPL